MASSRHSQGRPQAHATPLIGIPLSETSAAQSPPGTNENGGMDAPPLPQLNIQDLSAIATDIKDTLP